MKKWKRLVVLLLVLSMLAALCACSTDKQTNDTPGDAATPAEQATGKDTVTIQTIGGAGNLDPFWLIAYGFRWVIESLYEPLWTLGYNDGDGYEYVLATSVETPSATERIVHLREGVTFSNGNPFTADDVLFTLKLYQEDSAKFTFVAYVDVEQCEKIDDYTVRLVYTEPNRVQDDYFVQIVMLDAESYYDGLFVENAIGTGAYELVSYSPYDTVIMKARADYWGGEPAIKNVIGKQITEASQATNALLSGDLDIVTQAALNDVDYYESLDSVQVVCKPINRCAWVEYNTGEDSIFKDVNARLAVAWALDRDQIINIAWSGKASISKTFFPSTIADYDDTLSGEVYQNAPDLDKAKAYAEAAGLVGQTIVICHQGNANQVATCEIVQERLKEIGVNVEIRALDSATFIDYLSTNPDKWDLFFIHGEGYSVPNFVGYNILQNKRCVIDPALREEAETLNAAVNAAETDEEHAAALKAFSDFWIGECMSYAFLDISFAIAANADLEGFDLWMFNGVMVKDLSWK